MNVPRPAYLNWHDIAPHFRSKNDVTGSFKPGLRHFATSDHLLERKLEIASNLDRWLHNDHGTRLAFDFVARLKCEMKDGVTVSVVNAVAYTLEGADRVLDCDSSGRRPWCTR